jgi:hypothetical protein
MDPWILAVGVFALTFAGGFLGIACKVPAHLADSDSRDVVKAVMGLLATMTALVLSLLIATAKSNHDIQEGLVQDMASRVILLDRTLAHYGAEANPARQALRATGEQTLQQIWPDGNTKADLALPRNAGQTDDFVTLILRLAPHSDGQKRLLDQAVQLYSGLAQARISLVAKSGRSVQMPIVLVLVSWVTLLFIGFGLFAAITPTGIAALLVGSATVSTAVFLILSMDNAFTGPFAISRDVFGSAVSLLGQP